jgi:hypothetical protein
MTSKTDERDAGAPKVKNSGISHRQTQRKIIRQDLQDCAGSLFLPESADEKHVNPVNPV